MFNHLEKYGIKLRKTDSSVMSAGVFIEMSSTLDKWQNVCELVNHQPLRRLEFMIENKHAWWVTGKVGDIDTPQIAEDPDLPWLEHQGASHVVDSVPAPYHSFIHSGVCYVVYQTWGADVLLVCVCKHTQCSTKLFVKILSVPIVRTVLIINKNTVIYVLIRIILIMTVPHQFLTLKGPTWLCNRICANKKLCGVGYSVCLLTSRQLRRKWQLPWRGLNAGPSGAAAAGSQQFQRSNGMPAFMPCISDAGPPTRAIDQPPRAKKRVYTHTPEAMPKSALKAVSRVPSVSRSLNIPGPNGTWDPVHTSWVASSSVPGTNQSSDATLAKQVNHTDRSRTRHRADESPPSSFADSESSEDPPERSLPLQLWPMMSASLKTTRRKSKGLRLAQSGPIEADLQKMYEDSEDLEYRQKPGNLASASEMSFMVTPLPTNDIVTGSSGTSTERDILMSELESVGASVAGGSGAAAAPPDTATLITSIPSVTTESATSVSGSDASFVVVSDHDLAVGDALPLLQAAPTAIVSFSDAEDGARTYLNSAAHSGC